MKQTTPLLSRTLDAFRPVLVAMSLGAAAVGTATTAGAQANPTRLLTFIEVRSDTALLCKTALDEYESSVRRNTSHPRVQVLQEIGRPERFVLLVASDHTDELSKIEGEAWRNLEPLDDMITAPPDRRAHSDFDVVPEPAATAPVAPHVSTEIYVVAHVDIGAPDRDRGEAALRLLAAGARKSDGNLRFDIWRQTGRSNHFNIIAVWGSRAKFDAFAASPGAREFRRSIATLLGSPFDERIYRRSD